MYDIQKQFDFAGVRVRTICGSIFESEHNGACGVAIFVPCGLTALRCNLPEYMIPFGLPIAAEKAFTIFQSDRTSGRVTVQSDRTSGRVTVLCDENRNMALYPARGIPMLLDIALNLFLRYGIQHIAMNGIRVYWPQGVKDNGHLAEAYLVDNALYWLETHEHNFKSIDFVDLRGGFGKIHGEDPDEPSIRDVSAMPIVSSGGLWSTQNIPIQDMPHISSS